MTPESLQSIFRDVEAQVRKNAVAWPLVHDRAHRPHDWVAIFVTQLGLTVFVPDIRLFRQRMVDIAAVAVAAIACADWHSSSDRTAQAASFSEPEPAVVTRAPAPHPDGDKTELYLCPKCKTPGGPQPRYPGYPSVSACCGEVLHHKDLSNTSAL